MFVDFAPNTHSLCAQLSFEVVLMLIATLRVRELHMGALK